MGQARGVISQPSDKNNMLSRMNSQGNRDGISENKEKLHNQ